MKERIQWADSLKAFLIFCVVFGHIEVFAMRGYNGFFCKLQDSFCMPLFIFVSGMFAKKYVGFKNSVLYLGKKYVQLLVPFLVCGLTYTYIMKRPLISLFWYENGETHNGYWFVLVLFELIFIFSVCQFLKNKIINYT